MQHYVLFCVNIIANQQAKDSNFHVSAKGQLGGNLGVPMANYKQAFLIMNIQGQHLAMNIQIQPQAFGH